MTGWWMHRATHAALDRLAAGRALDPVWVTQFEAETVATVTQTGGDVRAALVDLRRGIEAAAAGEIHVARHARTAPQEAP